MFNDWHVNKVKFKYWMLNSCLFIDESRVRLMDKMK